VTLSPLDTQIVHGAACGVQDRAGVLGELAAKLERQRAPAATIRLLRETAAHLTTIHGNLTDVSRRMQENGL
jgi:hypothetical protein